MKMIRRLSTLVTESLEELIKLSLTNSLDLPGYSRSAANTAT